MTKCPQCRSEMSSDADFCGMCGSRLPKSNEELTVQPEDAERIRREQQAAIEEAQLYVVDALTGGTDKRAIVRDLAASGWPESTANQLVNGVEQALLRHKSSAEEPTPEQRQALDDAQAYVVEALAENTSRRAIINELVNNDWPEPLAEQIVSGVEQAVNEYKASPEWKERTRGKYAKHIFLGALWAGGGTAVTLATYGAAEGGGTYIIAWGAIIFGGLEFLYGLFGWLGNR